MSFNSRSGQRGVRPLCGYATLYALAGHSTPSINPVICHNMAQQKGEWEHGQIRASKHSLLGQKCIFEIPRELAFVPHLG